MVKRLITFIFIATGFLNLLKAGDETRNARVYGNNISNNAYIVCLDDKFLQGGSFTNYANKAVIEIGLDEEKHIVHPSFKMCVKFDVALTAWNGSITTYTGQQLDINYEPQELTRYKDKAQLVFNGFYKVKVYNIQMTACSFTTSCSSCTNNPPTDGYIQAEITTTR